MPRKDSLKPYDNIEVQWYELMIFLKELNHFVKRIDVSNFQAIKRDFKYDVDGAVVLYIQFFLTQHRINFQTLLHYITFHFQRVNAIIPDIVLVAMHYVNNAYKLEYKIHFNSLNAFEGSSSRVMQ